MVGLAPHEEHQRDAIHAQRIVADAARDAAYTAICAQDWGRLATMYCAQYHGHSRCNLPLHEQA